MKVFALIAALLLVACTVYAQDPAVGSWVTYAVAKCPPGTRMTHYEAEWTVPASPQPSDAFYSPWIGSDTEDNLDLIQPVNPWLGSNWVGYVENYQWVPSNNVNSNQFSVNSGDRLLGTMTYLGDSRQSYRVTQTDQTTGATSSLVVPVQQDNNGNYKNYTWLYAVFEKYAECYEYPPDRKVVFENIKVFCNGKEYKPVWTAHSFQNNCNFETHVINPETVSITWSTSGTPLTSEQKARNAKVGMRKHLKK